MGLHRHVRERRSTHPWLIAFVFALFLYPTVLSAAEDQDSILGTWKITVFTLQFGIVVDNALITFTPGGGLVADTRDRPSAGVERTTGHGTWVHRGGNTFEFAFENFVIKDGVYIRAGRLDETIDITGDTYKGEWRSRRISLDGKMSNVIGKGTTSAVRLKLLK